MAEAKVNPGMATTYSGGQGPVEPFDPKEYALTRDEIKGLVGDLAPGEIAHLKLDDHGKPTGKAFREIPQKGDVTAPVMAPASVIPDELVTPTGAPITKHMNPEPKMWDDGMLARNPPAEGGRPGDKPKGPIGGGVVNTPVTR